MSSPPQPPPVPETSQAAQAAVAVAIGLAIAKLWPSLDLLHLRQSLPGFKAAVAVEVQRHAQASATLAARQYRQQRVAAGVGGSYTPIPADPPPVEQIAQAVDWAVQPLWDSSVRVASIPDAPEETQTAAGSAIADAKARLAASAERQVLSSGWDTIADNVLRDRKAKAYARVPEPGACYFCAILATRGAVYKQDSFNGGKAKFEAHKDFPDADRAHDNCRCHLEPVWNSYEPSAQIRGWTALYKQVVTDQGRTGNDARTAFRQAIEGRKVTGETVSAGPGKPRQSAKSPQKTRAQATDGERADMVRAELKALEGRLPSLSTEQAAWTSSRIAVLKKLLAKGTDQ